MRNFSWQVRFARTILPCNTYSTFPPQEREQIIQTVRRHLQPGGTFAFSMPNPHLLASLDLRNQNRNAYWSLMTAFLESNRQSRVGVRSQLWL